MPRWWDRLLGRAAQPTASPASTSGSRLPRWLAANDPANPFRFPVLDLMLLQEYVAASRDAAEAERSVSWRQSVGADLDPRLALEAPPLECCLRYPAAKSLPEGILYAPPSMDQKWVIAWRNGRVVAARSWTGVVEAVADGRRDGGWLVLERLRVVEPSALRIAGRTVDAFDWLIRSHALGQRLPLPVDENAATLLERVPLSGFGPFGKVLFCAAKSWDPPPSERPLRSDGEVLVAARKSDFRALRRAVEQGADVNAPGNCEGYTALHLAVIRGDMKLFHLLVELGANPSTLADGANHALIIGVVNHAPRAILDALAASNLDLAVPNSDGFNALHAAGESDNADAVPWLVEHGLSLEARTKHGHTPLHIACALGHASAATALLDAGADATASSPGGTPLDVARAEQKPKLVALLERRLSR